MPKYTRHDLQRESTFVESEGGSVLFQPGRVNALRWISPRELTVIAAQIPSTPELRKLLDLDREGRRYHRSDLDLCQYLGLGSREYERLVEQLLTINDRRRNVRV